MGAIEDTARKLLKKHGIKAKGVLRVDPDSILYIDEDEIAMTAWLRYRARNLEIVVEPGFVAFRGVLFPDEIPVSADDDQVAYG